MVTNDYEVNAIGKPYGATFNPDYKQRASPTKISRLRRPCGPSMRFVGEEPRETRRRTRRPKFAPLLGRLSTSRGTAP